MRSFIAAIAFSYAYLFQTSNAQDPCSVCEDVHFFLARGNNEPYPGRQAMLVEATCDGLSSCGYENLYYSTLYTDLYCQTAYDGAVAGHVQITAYAEKCPHSKLILAGYSQGGQIASDILGGGGGYSFNGCFQPYTPAMSRDASPGNQIAAVMIAGDTRHDANQSYNYGNGSAIDGYFPRNETMIANLQTYAPIMRNYCVSSDPICAANQSSYNELSHLAYYDLDSKAMASFIQSVASLTSTTAIITAIPTSLSGTVQDYNTIGTATPSGLVKLDTTWTSSTSYPACTAASYTQASSTADATTTATSSGSSTASGSITAFVASAFPLTASSSSSAAGASGASASGTSAAASSSATSASSGATNLATTGVGSLVGLLSLVVLVLAFN
ncbi:hypothetical protein B0A48_14346 [Cryoendolithus antarcticus]|uniref:Cutinase n=1 Tax=Cryoendolithus antarcticus TaxID=1507870 RepID=A0A1V8SJW7_9PEZI|nr:hypothetical protein B0A48_14346 [Cryoendolithus antarcticus]